MRAHDYYDPKIESALGNQTSDKIIINNGKNVDNRINELEAIIKGNDFSNLELDKKIDTFID